MQRQTLHLPLLGTRAYLHGTTLFDALLGRVGAAIDRARPLVFRLSQRIDSDCVEIGPVPKDAREGAGAAATLSYADPAGRDHLVGVWPSARSPEAERISYDEALVSTAAELGPGHVVLAMPSPFSFVATLIPLHKLLLAEEGRIPGRPGQWFFARLDLSRMPGEAFLPLTLTLDVTLGGGTLVRSGIRIGEEAIGTLYFSWV